MAERSLLSDMLRRVALAARLTGLSAAGGRQDTITLCDELLSDRGEVSGLVGALQILDQFEAMSPDEQLAFFKGVSGRFGVDKAALRQAIAAWGDDSAGDAGQDAGDDAGARNIHNLSEPRSQELIRRINRVPGATARLVSMREKLVSMLKYHPDLAGLDRDFLHLFSSWFNRGFLEIQRIDWSTPAAVLEKIISYEAVHEITGWEDLRQRVADPDRRLFAFFHPAMPGDPLIFVEVALMASVPGAIGDILSDARVRLDPAAARVGVFYSISNCQKGLRGISFGNFLIKQVVSELAGELPGLTTFVTLSPVPSLRKWAAGAFASQDAILDGIAPLAPDDTPAPDLAARIAARYLTQARRAGGTAFDPVAHFHLGNGATLHAVHAGADDSAPGTENSWGVMVNYLYDGNMIEANHQAYVSDGQIVTSPKVRSLAKK